MLGNQQYEKIHHHSPTTWKPLSPCKPPLSRQSFPSRQQQAKYMPRMATMYKPVYNAYFLNSHAAIHTIKQIKDFKKDDQ